MNLSAKKRFMKELLQGIVNHTVDDLISFFLEDSPLSFLRAPAGYGKTACALAYLITEGFAGNRGAIFFRTRTEVNQALRLLSRMINNLPRKTIDHLSVIPLVGKDFYCRYPPEKKSLVKWWCKIIHCNFLSRYRSQELMDLLSQNVYDSLKKYYNIARDLDLCPYYVYQRLSENADIVLTTHPYIIRQSFLNRIGERSIVIIDEAHNLLKSITAKISKREYAQGESLERTIHNQNIDQDRFLAMLFYQRREKDLLILARYLKFQEEEGTIIGERSHLIKIVPPIQIIDRLLSRSKVILMSSTLYPISLYKTLFANKRPVREHIIKGFIRSTSRRKLAILKSGITSKFNERGDKTFWRYTSIIKKIYDSIKENIIVFAPSKNFAENLAKYIGAPILLEEPNRLMESLGISDLKDVPIIISVARSKLAEGIDLSYKGFTPRILLVIGLPFPKITQEDRIIIQFYSKIYNIKEPLLRKSLSLSSMFSALIQTIGRIGRKEKGFAIIVDDRILNFNLGIPVYNNPDQLVADVRSFLVS